MYRAPPQPRKPSRAPAETNQHKKKETLTTQTASLIMSSDNQSDKRGCHGSLPPRSTGCRAVRPANAVGARTVDHSAIDGRAVPVRDRGSLRHRAKATGAA